MGTPRGPASGMPRSGGPRSGGPRSGGPRSGGPRSGGPASKGSAKGSGEQPRSGAQYSPAPQRDSSGATKQAPSAHTASAQATTGPHSLEAAHSGSGGQYSGASGVHRGSTHSPARQTSLAPQVTSAQLRAITTVTA
ncbi:MAG: hypothetical protein CMN30_25100 [Sandaracinus sp.]|nr:hypothetical protein [Sandaracinus sp.]